MKTFLDYLAEAEGKDRSPEEQAELETPEKDMHDHHSAVQGNVHRARDVGGYDRIYHMNRLMIAMAKADGKSTRAVDSPAETWFEKYNTIHPYTDAEHKMAQAAMNTVPTDGKQVNKGKSTEPKDTHKVSPHRNPGPITRRK